MMSRKVNWPTGPSAHQDEAAEYMHDSSCPPCYTLPAATLAQIWPLPTLGERPEFSDFTASNHRLFGS